MRRGWSPIEELAAWGRAVRGVAVSLVLLAAALVVLRAAGPRGLLAVVVVGGLVWWLARRAKASALPAAGAYGWDVLFAYRRLPSATDVAAGVWPGLDIEGLDVQGETNPDGSHWTVARLAPRARATLGGLRLTVARRDDLIGGRLLYAPDPRVPTLAALDARLAARPGADAAVLVEVDEPGGRHPDADRAARWLAEALDGLASGPWVREAP